MFYQVLSGIGYERYLHLVSVGLGVLGEGKKKEGRRGGKRKRQGGGVYTHTKSLVS